MKRRSHPLLTFLGANLILFGTLLLFLQSRYFASILKDAFRKYMPSDFGVEGQFTDVAVQVMPPGLVLKNPSILLRDHNVVGLPGGTKLDAKAIGISFQVFQLIVGQVSINAVVVEGASFSIDLTGKPSKTGRKASVPGESIESVFRNLNFRSISLLDSKVDIAFLIGKKPDHIMRFEADTRELTIGRGSSDRHFEYDLAMNLQNIGFEMLYGEQSIQHSISSLQMSTSITTNGMNIRTFSVQQGDLKLHVNGNIRGNLLNPKNLKAELHYFVRGPLNEWFEDRNLGRYLPSSIVKSPPKGVVDIEGTLGADLMDFERTLESHSTSQVHDFEFDLWKVQHAKFRSILRWNSVHVENGEFEVAGGRVLVDNLVLDRAGVHPRLSSKLRVDNADLRKLLGPLHEIVYPIDLNVSGSIETQATLSPVLVSGVADLNVKNFLLRPGREQPTTLLAIPHVHAKGEFFISEEGLKLKDTEAEFKTSKLLANGSIGPNGFDLDMQGHVNLADIERLGPFPIAGEGELHWTVTGKKPNILLTFEPKLSSASYLNLNLGNLSGKIIWNDALNAIQLREINANIGRTQLQADGDVVLAEKKSIGIDVRVPKGTIPDFTTCFSNFISQSIPWYPRKMTGNINGLIKVTGKPDLPALSVEGDMEVRDVEVLHETFRYGRFHAGMRREAFVAENVNLQKKNGWLRGFVTMDPEGTLRFSGRSEGFSTQDIDHFAAFGIPYHAPLVIETHGEGKIGQLKSNTNVNVASGSVKTFQAPSSTMKLTTENGRIKLISDIFAGQGKINLDMGWTHGSNSSVDVSARHFNFLPILLSLNPSISDELELLTEVSGNAQLHFRTGELSRLSGVLELNSYQLHKQGYSLRLARPVHVEVKNGNYQVDNLQFVGEDTDLRISGNSFENQVKFLVNGNLNLRLSEMLVQPIASIRGLMNVNLQIYGHSDNPRLKGTLLVSNTDLRTRLIEQPFEGLQFSVNWVDSVLSLQDLSAKFAGGLVRGKGTVDLYLSKEPDLNLRFDLDNPKVKVYPLTYARTSGVLNVVGTEIPYKVKGNVVVADGLIQERFSMNSNQSKLLRSSKFFPGKGSLASGQVQFFDLDIDVKADQSILIKNDLFDAELKANLKILNNPQLPRLIGAVDILHGKLLFKDQNFFIQSGNVRFTNPAVLDPEFDMNAQTELGGYKIWLVASGRLSDPKLHFESQPPLSQNDIVSLLAIGVTSSEFQNIAKENRSAYTRDEIYGLIFRQTDIHKGLQEKFGVKVRVDQSQIQTPENVFRPRGGADVAETVAPKIVLQKQITNKLSASVGSTVGVGDNQEKNVDLEYSLGRRWSVLGVYEDQRGAQSKDQRTSVGADLKYKFRFK